MSVSLSLPLSHPTYHNFILFSPSPCILIHRYTNPHVPDIAIHNCMVCYSWNGTKIQSKNVTFIGGTQLSVQSTLPRFVVL